MGLNHSFWKDVFDNRFSPQLRALEEALERRVLPGFENIEAESRAVQDDAWQVAMSSPGTGDEDHSLFAEAARDAGVEHYFLVSGIRQGVVNMFVAALYHLFEQQLLSFHRKELLHPVEAVNSKLFSQEEMRSRLESYRIDVRTFSSWSRVEELRLVANTVKHAEGPSATELKRRRPDFFKEPGLPGFGEWEIYPPRRVFQPLAGEDVYLSVADMKAYTQLLQRFWGELIDAMEKI